MIFLGTKNIKKAVGRYQSFRCIMLLKYTTTGRVITSCYTLSSSLAPLPHHITYSLIQACMFSIAGLTNMNKYQVEYCKLFHDLTEKRICETRQYEDILPFIWSIWRLFLNSVNYRLSKAYLTGSSQKDAAEWLQLLINNFLEGFDVNIK